MPIKIEVSNQINALESIRDYMLRDPLMPYMYTYTIINGIISPIFKGFDLEVAKYYYILINATKNNYLILDVYINKEQSLESPFIKIDNVDWKYKIESDFIEFIKRNNFFGVINATIV